MKKIERFYTLLAPAVLASTFIPLILGGRDESSKQPAEWFAWVVAGLAIISLIVSIYGVHLLMRAADERRIKHAFSLFISTLVASIPWVGLALSYLIPIAKP